jgi:Fe-S-cluster-containing dehydrogenase component
MSQINKEFQGPSELTSLDRREFMKYLGLFSSMSFLANCSRRADKIIPFTREIAEFSRKNYEIYSTVINHQGFGQGILVKSFQGRPIKIEGNPTHPSSHGSTTPQAQAAMYDLYHPSRLQDLSWRGKKKNINELKILLSEEQKSWGQGNGVGFWFKPDHSPTQNRLIKALQEKYPQSVWLAETPWKQATWTSYDLKEADEVVSFDEDIFFHRPDYLTLSRAFMQRRREAIESNAKEKLNYLTVFESSPTLAGAKSDKALSAPQAEIWNHAVDLLSLLEGRQVQNPEATEVFNRLKNKKSVVIINRSLHSEADSLEKEINQRLRARTTTYDFSLPETHSFSDFTALLKSGKLQTLIMIDVDPFLWYPDLKKDMRKIPTKISLVESETTTSKVSEIVIAKSHFLECWSDIESVDKTISLQQPLIEPIFHSVSPLTFLSMIQGTEKQSYDIIKESYGDNLDEALRNGFIEKKSSEIINHKTKGSFTKHKLTDGFHVKITPDYSVGYGDNFKNPLLQELPKVFSRIVWQNAFYLNETDAAKLKVRNGTIVQVTGSNHSAEGPIWVVPRLASSTIVANLGYGQDKRGTNNFGFLPGEKVEIKKTIRSRKLAVVQENLSTEGQHPVQETSLPLTGKLNQDQASSLYPDHPLKHQEKGPQWGMTIDLTTCIGCQACVLACQVENNVPFVGEDQVSKGRFMHWLRIDTYQVNDKTFFQPVPCMHCEKAPCEVVCPVNATLHGNGGLNEMVYNRCVGTRYCSNNCPYRVRRFNFKAYSVLKYPYTLGFNPDVTVRDRGVMEKCTYCIQRIREGEVKGETSKVRSACAQVCPTEAIMFGDIRDQNLEVTKQKKSLRNYDLLGELGTVPRTSYLKVIRHEHG